RSPLATASVKPTSAASTCTAACSWRPRSSISCSSTRPPTPSSSRNWLSTATPVAALTEKYRAPTTAISNATSATAMRAWKLWLNFTRGLPEGFAESAGAGRLRCFQRPCQRQRKAPAEPLLRHLQGAGGQRLHVLQPRVPEADLVAPRRQAIDCQAPLGIADGEPGMVGDVDVTHHPVMDVAAEHHHTGLVEQHRGAGSVLVQAQFEALGRREGVDVVADVVAIGEADLGARANCQHPRA